jgi:DNA mismatch endonuclease, patch repair protein
MSRIRGGDTKPELIVRRLVHGLGYRYRLHVGKLPGRPDLVFSARRKVIFVHGCFWHQHECKRGARPAANREFWTTKLARNRERDAAAVQALKALGWRVMIVWECQIRDNQALTRRIVRFLGGRS